MRMILGLACLLLAGSCRQPEPAYASTCPAGDPQLAAVQPPDAERPFLKAAGMKQREMRIVGQPGGDIAEDSFDIAGRRSYRRSGQFMPSVGQYRYNTHDWLVWWREGSCVSRELFAVYRHFPSAHVYAQLWYRQGGQGEHGRQIYFEEGTLYRYDCAGRVEQAVYWNPRSMLLTRTAFRYNPAGQLQSENHRSFAAPGKTGWSLLQERMMPVSRLQEYLYRAGVLDSSVRTDTFFAISGAAIAQQPCEKAYFSYNAQGLLQSTEYRLGTVHYTYRIR